MKNLLAPGAAGLIAPSPKDQQANPPSLMLPPPGPSQMEQHYLSAEDKLATQFGKIKEAKAAVDATQQELEKLAAFGDTVTMDDVVEAAGVMVAAGVPAIQVASKLAEVPEGPGQIEAWVQEQLAAIAPVVEKVNSELGKVGYDLGLAGMKSIMAASAEEHFVKAALAGKV